MVVNSFCVLLALIHLLIISVAFASEKVLMILSAVSNSWVSNSWVSNKQQLLTVKINQGHLHSFIVSHAQVKLTYFVLNEWNAANLFLLKMNGFING